MFSEIFLRISYLLNQLQDPFLFIALVGLTAIALGIYRRSYALTFFITIALAFVANQMLKALFAIGRPEGALVSLDTYRFPSMHAVIAGAFITSMWWYAMRHVRGGVLQWSVTALAASAVVLVGASRLVLGVHEPIDIFVGSLLGIAVTFCVHYCLRDEIERN